MSNTPQDLEALRAAVLLSRSKPLQTTSLASTFSSTSNTAAISINSMRPDTRPSSASPSKTTATSTDSTTKAALTQADITGLPEVDREDGEIIDEESTSNNGTRPDSGMVRAPANPSSTTAFTPHPMPTRLIHPIYHSAQEKRPGHIPVMIRPLPLHPPPPAQNHGAVTKRQNRSFDVDTTPVTQDADFTALMAEYQLRRAKTDIKLPTATANVEKDASDDIPGLGTIKNPGWSPMESNAHERKNRSFANSGPRPGDHFRAPGSLTHRGGRRARTCSLDVPPPHRAGQHPELTTRLNQNTPAQQTSSKSQIYALVHQLMDHGISSEQFMHIGISPKIIQDVAYQRAPHQLVASTMPSHPGSSASQVMGFVANQQPSALYPSSVANSSLPQSTQSLPQHPALPPQQTSYAEQHSTQNTFTAAAIQNQAQNQWAPLFQAQMFLDQQQQQQQQQNQQLFSQIQPALTSATDNVASKQLEMIIALASQVLPQDWYSLLQNRGMDANGAPATIDIYQPTYGSSMGDPPSSTPCNEDIAAEQDHDRQMLLSQEAQSHEEQMDRALEERNYLAEAAYRSNETLAMSTTTGVAPSYPPPPPSHPPPSPPPPPAASPPSSPSAGIPLTSSPTPISSDFPPAETPPSAISDQNMDSASKDDTPIEAEVQEGSTSSQDEMDMELDDDAAQTTNILKGSWKTIQDASPEVAISQHYPHPKQPTATRIDSVGSSSWIEPRSAPASLAGTPTRHRNTGDQRLTSALSRSQRNGTRATAMDFIQQSHSPVPFIQERQQSLLIDIDEDSCNDDDDDDNVGDEVEEHSKSAALNMILREREEANQRQLKEKEDVIQRQLKEKEEAIQRQLKQLNERIKAKELAMQSSTSTSPSNPSTPKTPLASQSALNSPVRSPGSLSNVEELTTVATSVANVSAATSDMEGLRRSLSEHTTRLEQLRFQQQDCEQEYKTATGELNSITSANTNHIQDLENLKGSVDQAEAYVELKLRELEEAKRRLEDTRARIEPQIAQLLRAERMKETLRTRIQSNREKATEIKQSIVSLQQDIIRMRTRLVLLEVGSKVSNSQTVIATSMSSKALADKSTSAPASPTNYTQDPVSASGSATSTAAASSGTQNTSTLAVKRGNESRDQQSPLLAVKRPRVDVREILNKRMKELEQEQALLRAGLVSTQPNSLTSTSKTPDPRAVHSTFLSTVAPTQTASLNHSNNVATAPPPRVLLAPLQKPVAPSDLQAATSIPIIGSGKPPNTLKGLSKLDRFLAQVMNMPVTPASARPLERTVGAWRPVPGIKRLFLADTCICDLSQLCLPSKLDIYSAPGSRTMSQSGSTAVRSSTAIAQRKAQEYESPLTMFRSFRFSPRFQGTVRGGYRSLTYSNKIDPNKPMCIYELSGGACNDDSCGSQHVRDYTMTDEELVTDMARYTEGVTPELRNKFIKMQTTKLAELRASGIDNADQLIDCIIQTHQDFLHQHNLDPHQTVKFADRLPAIGGTAHDPAPKNSSKNSPGYRAVDRIIGNNGSDVRKLDDNPILMRAVSNLRGSSQKMKRYHEHVSAENYERLVSAEPHNDSIWVEYAIYQLSDAADENKDTKLQRALSVLSNAITINTTSENLWSFYMDLYSLHGTELETREMFEQCLRCAPRAELIWFRYYTWEKGRDERVYVLDRMLERACEKPNGEELLVSNRDSRFTLDVVLQILKTMVSGDYVESAKNWVQNFLTCASRKYVVPSSLSYARPDDVWQENDMVENIAGTLAARLLTPTDLCILWLAYVYLIWFHELPEELFFDYPNDYLSDNRLFEIHWPTTEELDQENELHSIVHDIFLGLTVYFVDCEARPSLVATLKNFVGFLMARGQQQEQILELVNPSKFPGSQPEIRDLFCQVQMHFDEHEHAKRDMEQAIRESPHQPYLWNRFARMLPDVERATCLQQCALAFFVVDLRHELAFDRSELTRLLYHVLLGLEVPGDFVAPPTRLDIATYKNNIFLWLNYLCLLALESRLSNAFTQLDSAFKSALDVLPVDTRAVVQTERATHLILRELDKTLSITALGNIISTAAKDINVTKMNPYDRAENAEVRVLPILDFSQVNRVVEAVWEHTAECGSDLRVDIIDSLLRFFPENPDLYLWMGEAEELAGHADGCRKVLVACLKRFPSSDRVWKRMLDIFVDLKSQSGMDLIVKASLISPLAAKVSKIATLIE
ncbi:Zinc finger C3H1 domain-containing protein [Gamsiella multidivaricata]|nr:Zinc finger C3H1 domain-containing protein [Gamsiella multidivaricata]